MFSTLPSLLAWSILLGLLHLMLGAALGKTRRGMAWNMSSRDDPPPARTLHGERAQRAFHNFMETFPFFAAALVCAIATNRDGYLPELGAQLYFWARVAYLPIYIFAVPVIRSLVWFVSIAGIVLLVASII
jgi:uncharacterized MAPEG superfamily protein